MTQVERECAARVLEQINYMQCTGDPTIDEQKRAVDTAIAALREQGQGYTMTADRLPDGERLSSEQGWVRTSERVPTEADDGEFGVVLAYNKALSKEDEMGLAACVCAWVVREGPEWWTYWMPLPALPEVEE